MRYLFLRARLGFVSRSLRNMAHSSSVSKELSYTF